MAAEQLEAASAGHGFRGRAADARGVVGGPGAAAAQAPSPLPKDHKMAVEDLYAKAN